VDRVFVSTRADQAGDAERSKYEQIVDRYEDIGPVAGILSAMDSNQEVSWLVLACDLPNIDDATIAYLLEQCSAEHPATAYASSHDGLPEPLCAIYRPQSRAVIDSFVEKGVICPRKMLINSDTHLLAQPNPDALHNVNSPEDLAGTGIKVAL
jgi:molybdopterin-guanine dinucleotide biosynthesis protein A